MATVTPTTGTTSTTQSTQKVLTLKPGDSTILKKGVKILSVIKDGNVSLTSSCPELSDILNNAETYTCYGFLTAIQNDLGGHSEPYQGDNFWFYGVRFNNVDYPFPQPIPWTSGTATLDEAMTKIAGVDGLIKSCVSGENFDSLYGTKRYTMVKVPPSVASSMFLIIQTHIVWAGDDTLRSYVPIQPASNFSSDSSVPACV